MPTIRESNAPMDDELAARAAVIEHPDAASSSWLNYINEVTTCPSKHWPRSLSRLFITLNSPKRVGVFGSPNN